MSVSVWTRYNVTQTMYQTVRGILPFRKSWSPEKLALAGRVYLQLLIDKLYGEVRDIFKVDDIEGFYCRFCWKIN